MKEFCYEGFTANNDNSENSASNALVTKVAQVKANDLLEMFIPSASKQFPSISTILTYEHVMKSETKFKLCKFAAFPIINLIFGEKFSTNAIASIDVHIHFVHRHTCIGIARPQSSYLIYPFSLQFSFFWSLPPSLSPSGLYLLSNIKCASLQLLTNYLFTMFFVGTNIWMSVFFYKILEISIVRFYTKLKCVRTLQKSNHRHNYHYGSHNLHHSTHI